MSETNNTNEVDTNEVESNNTNEVELPDVGTVVSEPYVIPDVDPMDVILPGLDALAAASSEPVLSASEITNLGDLIRPMYRTNTLMAKFRMGLVQWFTTGDVSSPRRAAILATGNIKPARELADNSAKLATWVIGQLITVNELAPINKPMIERAVSLAIGKYSSADYTLDTDSILATVNDALPSIKNATSEVVRVEFAQPKLTGRAKSASSGVITARSSPIAGGWPLVIEQTLGSMGVNEWHDNNEMLKASVKFGGRQSGTPRNHGESIAGIRRQTNTHKEMIANGISARLVGTKLEWMISG